MFAHLNPHSSDFGDVCASYAPFLHQLTMQSSLFEPGCPVSVVVCVTRKLRPCPSYGRRRDRINLGLWRSLYKGGGGAGYCVGHGFPPPWPKREHLVPGSRWFRGVWAGCPISKPFAMTLGTARGNTGPKIPMKRPEQGKHVGRGDCSVTLVHPVGEV